MRMKESRISNHRLRSSIELFLWILICKFLSHQLDYVLEYSIPRLRSLMFEFMEQFYLFVILVNNLKQNCCKNRSSCISCGEYDELNAIYLAGLGETSFTLWMTKLPLFCSIEGIGGKNNNNLMYFLWNVNDCAGQTKQPAVPYFLCHDMFDSFNSIWSRCHEVKPRTVLTVEERHVELKSPRETESWHSSQHNE